MQVGDRVRFRDDGSAGTIGDIAGNIVYVDLDNGTEHEVRMHDIVAEADYETPWQIKQRVACEAAVERDAISEMILERLSVGIVNLAKVVQRNAALSISMIGGTAGEWGALTPYQRLNFVSVATGISVDKWIDSYKTNTLSACQLVAYAMIGSALKEERN